MDKSDRVATEQSERVDMETLRNIAHHYVAEISAYSKITLALDELAWLRSYQDMEEPAPKEPYGDELQAFRDLERDTSEDPNSD